MKKISDTLLCFIITLNQNKEIQYNILEMGINSNIPTWDTISLTMGPGQILQMRVNTKIPLTNMILVTENYYVYYIVY